MCFWCVYIEPRNVLFELTSGLNKWITLLNITFWLFTFFQIRYFYSFYYLTYVVKNCNFVVTRQHFVKTSVYLTRNHEIVSYRPLLVCKFWRLILSLHFYSKVMLLTAISGAVPMFSFGRSVPIVISVWFALKRSNDIVVYCTFRQKCRVWFRSFFWIAIVQKLHSRNQLFTYWCRLMFCRKQLYCTNAVNLKWVP